MAVSQYASYGRIAFPQIEKRGGKILYSGAPLLDDPATGHWDRVILVYYPSRAAFLDMMADPNYRAGLPHRTAGLKRTVLYAFTQNRDAEAPLETVPMQGGDEIFVLNLLRFKPERGREDYRKYGQVVMPMLLERGCARAETRCADATRLGGNLGGPLPGPLPEARGPAGDGRNRGLADRWPSRRTGHSSSLSSSLRRLWVSPLS